MRSRRLAAAAVLSSLLVISACSGSETDANAEPDAAQSSVSDDAMAASDGPDVAAETAASDPDEAAATAAPNGQGVLGIDEAEDIAGDLLTKAALVRNGDGAGIEADVDAAFRGSTAVEALSADHLEKVSGDPEPRDLIADPVEPNVLAISREDGQSPSLMLVQTVPESGPPELYVMASPSADSPDDFRIVWWAPMLPGTDIGTFDRRSSGTPILREGTSGLSQSPKELLTALGDYIDYPARDVLEVETNGYAPQVREAAKAQAVEVSQQADYSESNTLKTQTYTFSREDGSAVTFATLKRESDFDVSEGMELTPPDEFLVFDDDDSITTSARLNTYVSVAMTIPQGSERPEMIAAREQLVSASGS